MSRQPYGSVFFDLDGGFRAVDSGKSLNVELVQHEFCHDIMIIELANQATGTRWQQSGVPIKMEFGWLGLDVATWVGYVNHVSTELGNSARSSRIVCVGATWVMKEVGNRTWAPGTNAHYAFGSVLTANRLSGTVQKLAAPALAGPFGQSWWSWLVQAAKKAGVGLAVNGTNVELLPRQMFPFTTAPRYEWQAPSSRAPQTPGMIWSFDVSAGQNVPGRELRSRAAWGVGDSSDIILSRNSGVATLLSVPETALFGQTESMYPVHSQDEADEVTSAAREEHKFNRIAHVEVTGDTRIRPGRTVVLKGIDGENDGYWYVLGARHVLSGNYRTHIEVGRDGTGDYSPTITPKARWYDQGTGLVDNRPAPPLPALVGTPVAAAVEKASRIPRRWVAATPVVNYA